MSNYQELTSLQALETAITASHETPVLFFKHSTTCPISGRAFSEWQQYLQTAASETVQHALIIVQTAREVSNKLAEITNVKHESPQAILVRNGLAHWYASHFSLKQETLQEITSTARSSA